MKLSKGWIVLIVIVGLILLLVGWVTGINNNLVTKEEGVNTAWANVENVYQRRLDLIPNLVNTFKGVAKFDRSILKIWMKGLYKNSRRPRMVSVLHLAASWL